MGDVLVCTQDRPEQDVVRKAVSCLKEGGVLIMPTDSVYGIGCAAIAHNPAHPRIFELKARPTTQTLPLLVAHSDELVRYAQNLSQAAMVLAHAFWPGALTLVVTAAPELAPEYVASDGTVALRCPNSELTRELCREAGPLATTSANLHGGPSPLNAAELEKSLVEGADLTLDGGPAPVGVASTIVDATSNHLRVLREGALSRAQLKEALYGSSRARGFEFSLN